MSIIPHRLSSIAFGLSSIALLTGCAMPGGATLGDGKIGTIDYITPAQAALVAYRPELAGIIGTPAKAQATVQQHPAASVTPEMFYRYLGAERILLPNETLPFADMQKEYVWRVIEKPTISPATPIDIPAVVPSAPVAPDPVAPGAPTLPGEPTIDDLANQLDNLINP